MSLWSTLFRSPLPGLAPTHPSSISLYSYDASKRRWSRGTRLPALSNNHLPFALLTWNVDFTGPLPIRRVNAALEHLEKVLSPRLNSPPPPPTIILLQEVYASCFPAFLSNAFVREFYEMTNVSSQQAYSTLTLVPKSLAPLVSSVSRIPFIDTTMRRDCLYIDIDLPSSESTPEPRITRLRIANTHLESLSGYGDTARPKQLEAISKLLTAPNIDCGLVAGDMNSISPSDQDLPQQVGLSDAWSPVTANMESPVEDSGAADTGEAEGHTWGYQPPCKYPPKRLDKILTVGKLSATDIKRIGVGLTVEVDGDSTWVSDHYGLHATISVQT
ncbi:Endonuclease/exonuclease/phosphatase [Mycena sp. CBHHK59/15]|nr:Endonuclease/exonuclease/phosphatase [Mycena sp. CBHHK59/15]